MQEVWFTIIYEPVCGIYLIIVGCPFLGSSSCLFCWDCCQIILPFIITLHVTDILFEIQHHINFWILQNQSYCISYQFPKQVLDVKIVVMYNWNSNLVLFVKDRHAIIIGLSGSLHHPDLVKAIQSTLLTCVCPSCNHSWSYAVHRWAGGGTLTRSWT